MALLLWAGGMAFNMADALGAGRADITPRASLLLYVLYGVPLVFILARARRERWTISLIDGVLSANMVFEQIEDLETLDDPGVIP